MRMLVKARNRSVGIEADRIVPEEGRFDIVIECPDAEVRPGLINAHDHLHRNHYGRMGRGPYPNAYRWAEDIQHRFRRRIARGRQLPRRSALLAGAWKNLFAGVTTVVHHDPWERDFDRDFPIRVARVRSADSLGMCADLKLPREGCFALHLAEGIDEVAACEVEAAGEHGLLTERLLAVHGVGVRQESVERFQASGAALVWCPTSNSFLFGRTAPAKLLDGGCDVLLGSDSRLTGEGDLLDEVRAARTFGFVEDERLLDAIGSAAARRLGLSEPSLEPRAKADLVLLRRPLLEASSADVRLTIVGGLPRVASSDIARRLGRYTERGAKMRIAGVERWTYELGRIAR